MPKEYGRHCRIARLVKEELSVLIQRQFPLKQYGMITLTNVDVSPDLKRAMVFFTTLNSPQSDCVMRDELNQQAGCFRREIARVMYSKSVPILLFKYDESIQRAERLTEIIDSVCQ